MTSLKEIQAAMHQDAPSMAELLGVNYETYRAYYYGKRVTPADVLDKARSVLAADRQWMTGFKQQLGRELDLQYPMGIKGE